MVSVQLEAGLGNQMFQTAFIYAYAKKHGFEYCVPTSVKNAHISGKGAYKFSGINYSDEYVGKLDVVRENSFPNHFMYQDFPPQDNVIFEGFFQSAKYFDEYRDEILKAFGFERHLEKGWCGVHVRRGDYLLLPDYHPFVGEKYLKDAVIEMNKRTGITHFRIFSNDTKWCNEFFATIPEPMFFHIVEGKTELEDMAGGSCCENFILSNSTFSWWQYYLNKNPNKICLCPQRWFGHMLPHNTTDLYPPEAIILPNE